LNACLCLVYLLSRWRRRDSDYFSPPTRLAVAEDRVLSGFGVKAAAAAACILMPTRCHRHQETISKKYSAHTARTPFFSVSHNECQHVPDYFINSRNKCQHVISHKRRFQQFRQDNHRSHAATLILKTFQKCFSRFAESSSANRFGFSVKNGVCIFFTLAKTLSTAC
jgi:hypothetical protein